MGELSAANSGGKDVEDRNGVAKGAKVRVKAEAGRETAPDCPYSPVCAIAARNDSGSDLVLHKAEIRAESIGSLRR